MLDRLPPGGAEDNLQALSLAAFSRWQMLQGAWQIITVQRRADDQVVESRHETNVGSLRHLFSTRVQQHTGGDREASRVG